MDDTNVMGGFRFVQSILSVIAMTCGLPLHAQHNSQLLSSKTPPVDQHRNMARLIPPQLASQYTSWLQVIYKPSTCVMTSDQTISYVKRYILGARFRLENNRSREAGGGSADSDKGKANHGPRVDSKKARDLVRACMNDTVVLYEDHDVDGTDIAQGLVPFSCASRNAG
ncbi:hypothetical protein GUITHDRAFT_119075 [Guillardia theta CCMP2712]|uniref:Uncharacterized protein n=1 Tax=Guillardia theta (strain CCMP2712) TaxID=905079 RepID=L1IG22_GUITC|nr:hypothetical protein GUITHDRAFT_119075 [Guillardia theta CCMP2712]EKX34765.1 hypothetical protein GUITHDRAFT_119075 [Guillardia theta CCMP2712]|eukprot:XP_005821745.1 hypothetical protein GUITHDRAFT_119075 [Guillardia theta CCMP2712]